MKLSNVPKKFKLWTEIISNKKVNFNGNDVKILKELNLPKFEQNYDSKVKMVVDIIGNKKIPNVLDFGAGDGGFMKALIKERSDIKNGDCLEIENWFDKFEPIKSKKINWYFYNGDKLPNFKKKYDLIVFNSVLHHIPRKNVKKLMSNLPLKKNGRIIIREHNVLNKTDKETIDLQHLVYYSAGKKVTKSMVEDFWKDYYSEYFNINSLFKLFDSFNGKIVWKSRSIFKYIVLEFYQ